MMECRHVRLSMPAFLDGDLSPANRCAVEAHLAECPACAEELDRLDLFFEDTRLHLECPAPVPAFAELQDQLHLVEPIDEIRAFLPRLKIRQAVPRFVVASVILVLAGASQYLIRNTWQILSQGRSTVVAHRVSLDDRLEEALDPGYDADQVSGDEDIRA